MSSEKKSILAFVAASLVLFTIGGISYRSTRQASEATESVVHTYEVLGNLEGLLSSLQDVETGARGYVLTGDDRFLAPYLQGRTAAIERLGTLRHLTSDNPSQQQRLDLLAPLVSQRVRIAEGIIDMRRREGLNAALQEVRDGEGKNVMDQVRQTIAALRVEEQGLLQLRQRDHLIRSSQTTLTLAVLALFTLLLIAGSYYSIHREIKKRTRAQKAARQNEEKYRSLVSNIPDVTWTADSHGNSSFISPNISNVYGYSPEEIYRDGARLWFDQIHPDDQELVKQSYEQLFAEQKPFDVEYRIRKKDGEWIWLQDRAIGVYEKDGVMLADGLFSDITRKKEIEEALRESDEQFRLILNSTAEGIYGMDMEGHWMFCNEACKRMLGYEDPSQFRGRKVHDLIHHTRVDGTSFPLEECRIQNALREGMCTHADDEVYWRADGTSFPVEYFFHPVRRNGELIGGVLTFLDITKRKRLQEQTESLLNNILPGSIAEELRLQGAVRPKYYEDVTVLFADFAGFTQVAEHLAADELVRMLHEYFCAFDTITKRFGLEKLKTIGDAYMCVGGLPSRRSSHPVDVVLAAFEMIQAVRLQNRNGRPAPAGLRIGIHTGPVVAGVVGNHKFAFDIWGETVNLASRMEMSGMANRINLSEQTYARVKDFFQCEYRGEVLTKDRKEIDMYFATGILPSLADGKQSIYSPEFLSRYRAYFLDDPPAFSVLHSESVPV